MVHDGEARRAEVQARAEQRAARDGAANGPGEEHAGEAEIVGVPGLTRSLPDPILPRYAPADRVEHDVAPWGEADRSRMLAGRRVPQAGHAEPRILAQAARTRTALFRAAPPSGRARASSKPIRLSYPRATASSSRVHAVRSTPWRSLGHATPPASRTASASATHAMASPCTCSLGSNMTRMQRGASPLLTS